MQKISKIGIPARDAAIKGANYLADAVRSTIGPFGMNFLIEKGERITNDGVTVSRELIESIEDEFERRGASILHKASAQTNDMVGDATSSAEALAQAILHEMVRFLPKEGSFISKKTPSQVKILLEEAKQDVLATLKEMVTEITTQEELIASARVSVENEELAQLIGAAQWKLGKDGFILAEETAEPRSSIEVLKGIRMDNGMGATFMINNAEKQTLEVDESSVILTNYTLADLKPLESILNQISATGQRKITIIARAFTQEAIRICAENHKSGLFLYPLNAPYTDQREIMKDFAAVLGGSYVDQEDGTLEDMNLSDVGFASKIIAKRYDAIITGKDTPETETRVLKRLHTLQEQLDGEVSEFQKKSLESRIAQLKNGFAVLKVGATNETERKYQKDKCDDAVNAVRLAFKGGTVKGAGLAFKEISDALEEGNILKKPLLVINQQILSSAPEGFVVEEWVRDPYLVLKAALENACSVAGTLATVAGIVTTKNRKEKSDDED